MPGVTPTIPCVVGRAPRQDDDPGDQARADRGRPARANVAREYDALRRVGDAALARADVTAEYRVLRAINETLWDVEDAIREEEAQGRFGDAFVALARSVYRRNDERAAAKRRINLLLESELVEEKSYRSFA